MGSDVGCVKEIKSAIEWQLRTKVRVMGPKTKRVAIHIRGMEITTGRKEVKQAIMTRVIGLSEDDFSLGDMRANKWDTQAVTVVMGEKVADELMKDPYIRIGYVRCRMEKRLEVKRCYKCWGFEHEARECTGKDRSRCCFVCGEEGHKGQDCKGEDMCGICNEKGHRTGTGKCEAFRRALRRAREEERKRRLAAPPFGGVG
ncbi:uncharacterized protein [Euwallacea fornicatus]